MSAARQVAWWVAIAGCMPGNGSLTIDRVEPASGRAGIDMPVRIGGANFHLPVRSDVDDGTTAVGSIAVTVGDVPLVSVTRLDARTIDGVVPAGLAPGTYPISVVLGEHSDVLVDGYTVTLVGSSSFSVRAIDIVDAEVAGGPHVDFPLLVSFSDPWLRDALRGGEVARPDGFDLYFTADQAGTQRLAHEIERYEPTTGGLVAWVKVPALGATTTIYVHCGDPMIAASQQDAPAVWSAGYELVMHMGAIADGTGQTTTFDTVTTAQPVGQIEGAHTFDGIDDRIIVGSVAAIDDVFAGGGTSEGWFYANTIGENGFGRFFDKGHINGWSMSLDVTAQTLALVYGSASTGWGEWLGATNVVTFDSWHHAAIVFDSDSSANDPQLYIDGVQTSVRELVTPSGATDSDASFDLYVGNQITNDRTFDGQLDELRLSTVARSSDWLLTQYRNQARPDLFITVGPRL